MNKVLVSFVFNSPVLVPWGIVKDVLGDEGETEEKILLWQEAFREGHKFKENQEVVEMNNPTQKMMVRRILRKEEKYGDEIKKRLIGIECYWWSEPTVDLIRRLVNMDGRLVPGQIEEPNRSLNNKQQTK